MGLNWSKEEEVEEEVEEQENRSHNGESNPLVEDYLQSPIINFESGKVATAALPSTCSRPNMRTNARRTARLMSYVIFEMYNIEKKMNSIARQRRIRPEQIADLELIRRMYEEMESLVEDWRNAWPQTEQHHVTRKPVWTSMIQRNDCNGCERPCFAL